MTGPEFPPQMSALDAAEFKRRRRGRNYAMLAALLTVVVLFYAITIVRKSGG